MGLAVRGEQRRSRCRCRPHGASAPPGTACCARPPSFSGLLLMAECHVHTPSAGQGLHRLTSLPFLPKARSWDSGFFQQWFVEAKTTTKACEVLLLPLRVLETVKVPGFLHDPLTWKPRPYMSLSPLQFSSTPQCHFSWFLSPYSTGQTRDYKVWTLIGLVLFPSLSFSNLVCLQSPDLNNKEQKNTLPWQAAVGTESASVGKMFRTAPGTGEMPLTMH